MIRLINILNNGIDRSGMESDKVVKRFYKHCIAKNLSSFTLECYQKVLEFFKDNYPVEYLSQIDLDYIEDIDNHIKSI